MNVALWIVQGLLAAVYLMAGSMKVLRPKDALVERMGWVADSSAGFVKFIGSVEVLGALGLVLPWALKIVPILTPIAAAGLVVVMIGAAGVHLRRHEGSHVPPAVVLGLLAAFVVVGRFVLVGA